MLMMIGIGIYMLYNKPVPIQAKQITQPPQQSKPDIDPFEMNKFNLRNIFSHILTENKS